MNRHPPHVSVPAVLTCLLTVALPFATRAAEPDSPDAKKELTYWLENMVRVHNYTEEEVREATGLAAAEVTRLLEELGLEADGGQPPVEPRADDGRLLVVPYPGGRHPRIGFLDGAIDPWRETKFSVVLPWKGAGYAVVDLPEALWANGKLHFLAHTHIPTVWDEKGIALERDDWERLPGGRLENRFAEPGGIVCAATVTPAVDAVHMTLRLKNCSRERLTQQRSQICVMLKGAPDFNEQTNDNKRIEPKSDPLDTRMAAVHAAGKDRWIVTMWTRAGPWANPPCPCLHADPVFPDLDPGEEATLFGRLFFHEGEGLDAKIETHRRELDRLSQPKRPIEPRLLTVRKIWDRGEHNAFTDLVRFGDRWLCVFREGKGHVSPDGALRVISSPDGDHWTSNSLLTSSTADLRDAKISITPDGRLYLSGAAALHQPGPIRHQSLSWFSPDGVTWSQPYPIGDADLWLWRVDWHQGSGYGIGYSTTGEDFIRLYSTRDGIRFEPLVSRLRDGDYANESSFVFRDDGSALCLLRRDPRGAGEASALLGAALPPYTDWTWKDLGVRVGGPKLLELPDGRLVAGVRLYDGGARTSLCRVEPATGTLTEILELPSGGDTSYPGMVYHEGLLWVSYYASHEGRTSIYLARADL